MKKILLFLLLLAIPILTYSYYNSEERALYGLDYIFSQGKTSLVSPIDNTMAVSSTIRFDAFTNITDIADSDEFAIWQVSGANVKNITYANLYADLNGTSGTLTNKTIDADNNTISNLGTGEIDDIYVLTAGDSMTGTINLIGSATYQLDGTDLNAVSETLTNKTISLGSNTLSSTSAQLRTALSDESGTGAAIFAGGAIGAATATTPSTDDNDTSVATTAYVQGEINGAGGTDLTCSSGQCNVDDSFIRNDTDDEAGGTIGFPDDKGLDFGTGDDFHMEFDNTATALVIEDGSGNNMVSITDIGTEGTMSVSGTVQIGTVGTNPSAMLMSDSNGDCWIITVTTGGTLTGSSAGSCAW